MTIEDRLRYILQSTELVLVTGSYDNQITTPLTGENKTVAIEELLQELKSYYLSGESQ